MLQIMEKRLVIVRDAWNAVQRYCDNSHESIKTHQSSASFCDLDYSVIEGCLQPAPWWSGQLFGGQEKGERPISVNMEIGRFIAALEFINYLGLLMWYKQSQSAQWYQGLPGVICD